MVRSDEVICGHVSSRIASSGRIAKIGDACRATGGRIGFEGTGIREGAGSQMVREG